MRVYGTHPDYANLEMAAIVDCFLNNRCTHFKLRGISKLNVEYVFFLQRMVIVIIMV